MSVSACVYVHAYVCVRACVYVPAFVCVRVRIRACVRVCARVCVRAGAYMRACVQGSVTSPSVGTIIMSGRQVGHVLSISMITSNIQSIDAIQSVT